METARARVYAATRAGAWDAPADLPARSEPERPLSAAAALEHLDDRVVITDVRGVIRYVNPAFERRCGYTRAEAIGKTPSILRSGAHDAEFYALLWRTIQAGECFRAEFVNRTHSGELVYEDAVISPIKDEDGVVTHYVLVGRDIRAQRRERLELKDLAERDDLTGLMNRRALFERGEAVVNDAADRHSPTALLFVDLDRFKPVNDVFGHAVGDAVLAEAARRIREVMRAEDLLGRVGGDEFAAVLPRTGAVAAAGVGRRIAARLRAPFPVGEHQIEIGASVGIAVVPGDAPAFADGLRRADMAMYGAKRLGVGVMACGDRHERPGEGWWVEDEYLRAIDRGELRLHFQPVVDARRGSIAMVEALLRWEHPVRGLLEPRHFVQALETTGAIVAVDRWVVGAATAQWRAWSDAGMRLPIAINASPRTLQHPEFGAWVDAALWAHGMPPENLVVEITESVALGDDAPTNRTIADLASRGVRIALDDFGTGYSSLSYVRRFPVNLLKVDRSLFHRFHPDGRDGALAEALARLAHALGLEVLAEGVEDPEVVRWLGQAGYDLVQGWAIAQPMAPGAIPGWIAQGRAASGTEAGG